MAERFSMQVRVIVPLMRYGNTQWLQGQIAILPDALAKDFVDRKEAVLVPTAEQAVMPRPSAVAVPRPRPTSRPKPETRNQSKTRGR